MQRDGFGSQFGALLALVGSAVGLGNLWKFPYMAGSNGGAAFILIYLGFILVLCLPLMLCEFIIGRRSQSNPVGAFKKLAPGTPWYLTGTMGVLAAFFILSFYCVVGGWVLRYLIISFEFGFSNISDTKEAFETFSTSTWKPVVGHLIFLIASIGILWSGIKNGIEKYSKILVPVLFVMIIILAIYSICLPGAEKGIDFMIKPDWSKVDSRVIINALGHGLFSLSLGMGCVITYSSYMRKTVNLTQVALITCFVDIAFALLAGFVIFPAVFAFGGNPAQGPQLLFVVLPQVFQNMPGGDWFALIFFIILTIAAITSAMSLLEVITSYLIDQKKISRHKSLIFIGCILAVTGSLCSLSESALSHIKIFGYNMFDFFDKISSIYMMPIGAFLMTVFVGWQMKKVDVKNELSNEGRLQLKIFEVFWFLIRYLVPIGIVIIFLNELGVL